MTTPPKIFQNRCAEPPEIASVPSLTSCAGVSACDALVLVISTANSHAQNTLAANTTPQSRSVLNKNRCSSSTNTIG